MLVRFGSKILSLLHMEFPFIFWLHSWLDPIECHIITAIVKLDQSISNSSVSGFSATASLLATAGSGLIVFSGGAPASSLIMSGIVANLAGGVLDRGEFLIKRRMPMECHISHSLTTYFVGCLSCSLLQAHPPKLPSDHLDNLCYDIWFLQIGLPSTRIHVHVHWCTHTHIHIHTGMKTHA